MKKHLKNILLLIFLVLSIFLLTGCHSYQGIEGLAYVVALGIDKGVSNAIKLSIQIAVLNQPSGSSSSSQSTESTVISVDCSTIDSGIALINSYISKKVNISHCKAIIISEELATDGISDHIFTLANNIEVRPDCNIIISRCSASDFLENSRPVLESISARYYELILNSSEYTAYIDNIYLSDFYSNILNTTTEATAILGGLNSNGTKKEASSSIDLLNGNYKADEVPLEATNKIANLGLAVFSGDRLVGELNNMETLCHMIITNNLETATITIPNPVDLENNISLNISLSKPTKNTVKLVNGFPYISSQIYISSNMYSLDSTLDLSDNDTLIEIQNTFNDYLEKAIAQYLYKTSKELKADIVGFGEQLLSSYITWDDWIQSDWLNNYSNSFFEVNVESNVKSGYLFTKI